MLTKAELLEIKARADGANVALAKETESIITGHRDCEWEKITRTFRNNAHADIPALVESNLEALRRIEKLEHLLKLAAWEVTRLKGTTP